MSDRFPPAFIADGNDGTFPDQARELGQRLSVLGVKNAVDLPPIRDGRLGHVYMMGSSLATDRYNRSKLAFLSKILG